MNSNFELKITHSDGDIFEPNAEKFYNISGMIKDLREMDPENPILTITITYNETKS